MIVIFRTHTRSNAFCTSSTDLREGMNLVSPPALLRAPEGRRGESSSRLAPFATAVRWMAVSVADSKYRCSPTWRSCAPSGAGRTASRTSLLAYWQSPRIPTADTALGTIIIINNNMDTVGYHLGASSDTTQNTLLWWWLSEPTQLVHAALPLTYTANSRS